jgi:hypothetical protein
MVNETDTSSYPGLSRAENGTLAAQTADATEC